ncbi:MAG TPA: polysaccharide deacetylase family protein [Clostridia bacterium]|nr:polysaccharide deacetylase family protein [Clostridia bacterium]
MGLDIEGLPQTSSLDRRATFEGWYRNEEGSFFYKKMKKQVGWQEIEDSPYHFNEQGLMTRGWLEEDHHYYLCPESGARAQGWTMIDDKHYYFHPKKGEMIQSAWITEGDKRYYIKSSGNPAKDLYTVDGVDYYFDERTGECLLDASKPMIALTFDDGPVENTEELLDFLDENSVDVSFFLQGKSIPGKEDLVKRMQEEGHTVGNHSYNHPKFTELSEEEILWQVEETDRLIYEATGSKPIFFRSPYGLTDKRIESVLARPTILWSVDSEDWNGRNADEIHHHLIDKAKDGDIVLMHDTYSTTIKAIKKTIPLLREREFQFVNMETLFKVKGQKPQGRDVYYYLE